MLETNPQNFLPLSEPAYLILGILSDRILHGYGIIKLAQEEHKYELLTGTLYRNLEKLLSSKLIKEVSPPKWVDSNDTRRKYYTITGMGEQVFDLQWQHYNNLVSIKSNGFIGG